MSEHRILFDTIEEALAFLRGLEFVQDQEIEAYADHDDPSAVIVHDRSRCSRINDVEIDYRAEPGAPDTGTSFA